MIRLIVSLLAVFAICAAPLRAVDDKGKKDTKAADTKNAKVRPTKATITKMDAKAGTITVKMKDKDGKNVEKTFRLTEDVRYFDSTGKAVLIDVFQSGHEVLVVEHDGKLMEMRKDKDVTSGDKKPTK